MKWILASTLMIVALAVGTANFGSSAAQIQDPTIPDQKPPWLADPPPEGPGPAPVEPPELVRPPDPKSPEDGGGMPGEKDGGGRDTFIVPGANDGSPGAGTDGALNPAGNITINLAEAASGPDIHWDTPAPVASKGVYDPEKWAVVFKYSSVNIASGRTVTFLNHPSGAPVVWLVQGDVTIAGTVSLSAGNYVPGPGGFAGGRAYLGSSTGSGGCGPGGGPYQNGGNPNGSGGSYGSSGAVPGGQPAPTYGNPGVFPLIGGSGGSSRNTAGYQGGGGGGAILIATPGAVTLNGAVTAYGANGSSNCGAGSGGGLRLISDTFTGSGSLAASGGSSSYAGGVGRIRLEINNASGFWGSISPAASAGLPGAVARIWPESTVPLIRATMIGGQPIPSNPQPRLLPRPDVEISTTGTVALTIEAENVPLDWVVKAHVVPLTGADSTVTAAFVSGDALFSIWEAQVNLSNGLASIQVQANRP